MTDETNGAAQTDAEDTAAVLNQAAGGEKTYLEPKAEEPTPEDPGEDDAAAQPEPEAEAHEPKPKKTAKERIDQLTWEKRELERQNQALLDRISGRQPAQEAQTKEPQGDGRPDPQGYEGGVYDPQYLEDLTDWKADQAVERRLSQRDAQSRTTTALQTFEQRVAEQFPDGEPAGLERIRQLQTLSPVIQEVMLESDIGPKLADHLGANPRELARISALPPIQQARELTKLELKLATPPAPTPKTATDAPEPTPTLRGQGGRFKVAPDTSDFAAFEATYKLGG